MHNGVKTLLLHVFILLSLTCCSFQKPAERKKQILVAPHTDNYKDTLLWTIELKHNNSEHVKQIPGHSHDLQDDLFRFGNIYIHSEGQTESDRNLARKIAPECNLTFLGHIGHLKNIYLFGHALSEHTEQNTTHQFINVNFKTLKSVIDDIETKLDNHDNVVWFHREKVFSREKRRIQFSDPAYNQQWHLVRWLLLFLSLLLEDFLFMLFDIHDKLDLLILLMAELSFSSFLPADVSKQ